MIKDYSKLKCLNPDHVVCNYCMTDMYVDYDTCVCPHCGRDGFLMDVEQDVEKKEFDTTN